MMNRFERMLVVWADVSMRYRWWILAVALVVFGIGIFFASKLTLRSDLMELLPTDAPSVVELERLKERVSSYATLTVAIESPDLASSQRFAEALAQRLETYPLDEIQFVDYKVVELTDFFKKYQLFYADYDDLVDFRDRLAQRIREETQAALIESLDDEEVEKTDLQIAALREKYEKKAAELDRYPDGFYVTPDRSLVAIFVRPPSSASGFAESERLVERIQRDIDELDPRTFHPEMTTGFTGDVKTGLEERDALVEDVTFITTACFFLLLVLVTIYYRSARAVLIVGVPTFIGVALTFAAGYAFVGYLNMATAFLTAIVAGNGINFMVMLSARFYEEIQKREPDQFLEAMRVAVPGAARGTMIAAAATAISYGSLVVASFRGFRQFGIIGGLGMLLCWITAYAFGPALIAAMHKLRPLGQRGKNRGHQVTDFVGKLVVGHPGKILVGSVVVTLLATLAIIPYAQDPFEYDFRNLRNRISKERGSSQLSGRVDKIFDLPTSPTPLFTDDAAHVTAIKEQILAQPNADNIIGGVKTLYDFLPKDQEKKLPVIQDLRRLIDSKIDFLSESDRQDVEKYRPPDDLQLVGIEDIPEKVAWTFSEKDGTRGRILYVYAKPGESLLDGRYLLKFAEFIRNVPLDVPLSAVGQPMVFADMVDAILHDGVLVTAVAFAAVMVLLLLAFRSSRALFAIIVSVTLGTVWMLAGAALFDLKLNFLNFVVIPITLGLSVDYGANIFARYRQEGPGSMKTVIRSTGGAVFLCSVTTMLGYATLILSTNMALQTFGIIADIGEITGLLSAELTMCAFLVWMERRKQGGQG